MASKNETTDKFAELRKRAQDFLKKKGDPKTVMFVEDVQRLVHELDTYQIELELQNDDLREAQIQLDDSRQRFSDLYDFAPVGYLTISDRGLIMECNLQAARMLGVERESLVDKPLGTFIIPDDQGIYLLHRQRLLKEKQSQTCKLKMAVKGGSNFLVQMESTVCPTIDGKSGQFRTCMTDISKEVLLQQKLEESRVEWEKCFDAITDIVTIQDSSCQITRANKATCDFFNASLHEIIGKKCYELFCGTSSRCEGCHGIPELSDTDSTSATIKNSTSAVIFNKTLGKTFHVSLSPITGGGKVDSIVHVARDITEQKNMEEKLYQSKKMESLGVLAGGIAHDFNNILSAILGFSELAKQECLQGGNPVEDIDEVITSGRRAVDLVNQILAFGRKSEHHLQSFEPHLVVKEAMKMLRATIPTSITINEDISSDCGMIQADPIKIHQILVNLFTNARQSIGNENGKITVKLRRQEIDSSTSDQSNLPSGPYLVLQVRDTGQGMDKETIERIFEPYFSTKEAGKSSGLGLAIIYGIVEDYKGLIEVESVPGKGTSFEIYIPALLENVSPAVEAVSDSAPLTGKETILVVDDEQSLVNLQKKVLERLGYTVFAMTNSEEALEKFREDPECFDLMITDQTMPNLCGFNLAVDVLKIKPGFPVILCSGYTSAVTEEDTLAEGIKRYVTKPVGNKALAIMVRELLDKKRSTLK
jgi:PAS domain S-box-containing protein